MGTGPGEFRSGRYADGLRRGVHDIPREHTAENDPSRKREPYDDNTHDDHRDDHIPQHFQLRARR